MTGERLHVCNEERREISHVLRGGTKREKDRGAGVAQERREPASEAKGFLPVALTLTGREVNGDELGG